MRVNAVSLIFAGQPIVERGLFVAADVSIPLTKGQVKVVLNEAGSGPIELEDLTPMRLQFCGESFPKGDFLYSGEFRQHLDDLYRDGKIIRMWHKPKDLTINVKSSCRLE